MCAHRSLIRIFTGHILDSKWHQCSSCGQRRLIRLCGCTGWFESSLGAHVRRYVFSRCGSNSVIRRHLHNENTPIQIYWEFIPPKKENFQVKNSGSFHISAQNIDCGIRENRIGEAVLTSTHNLCKFLSRNRKLMYTPVNPSFTYESRL